MKVNIIGKIFRVGSVGMAKIVIQQMESKIIRMTRSFVVKLSLIV